MIFLTYWFVLFVAILYPVYWFARWPRVRVWVLIASCAVFHTHFAGPAGVIPIVVMAVGTYLVGLTRNRWLCYLAVVGNAGALVYFKYTKFLVVQVLAHFWPSLAAPPTPGHPAFFDIIPPLAISFFVFEFVHYLIEVSRGQNPIRNPLDFTLFSIFWPSIAAGPVKRYQEFLPALWKGLGGVNEDDVAAGMFRVGVGFVKKCVADVLTTYLAFWGDPARFDSMDVMWRWAFVVFLALRILWDFSGYSDMAIGFARMHGVRLAENFNWPYLATSLTDFWRRWHVSLSTWIRDYVYVLLGGNRCGLFRKVLNGLLAFGLCGLWHGAGWNFLFWGLYHGLGLAVASSYSRWLPGAGRLNRTLEKFPQVGWAATLMFVGVGWLFFFYPLPRAFHMIHLLVGGA
jgi:alginate O-acetyltransferase complex protein AlgI